MISLQGSLIHTCLTLQIYDVDASDAVEATLYDLLVQVGVDRTVWKTR